MKTVIIGPGRVGTALGEAFKKKGIEIIGIVSRNKEHAKKCMKLTGCNYWTSDPQDVAKIADLILITVPDSSIKDIVSRIKNIIKPTTVLVHTSGTLPASILCTTHSISMHPISAFAGGKLQPQTYFGIEGDIKIAKKLVNAIDGIPVVIPEGLVKPLYHAGLNFGAAYILTLLDIGERLMKLSGFKNSSSVILSLAESTLRNAKKFGVKSSFTGPIARRDAKIIEKELNSLRRLAPDVLKINQLLIKETEKCLGAPT